MESCKKMDEGVTEVKPLLSKSRHNRRLLKYGKKPFVPSKGAMLVLIWTALIHSFGFYPFFSSYMIHLKYGEYLTFGSTLWPYIIGTAFSQLLYPIAGLLAEVYWTRYHVMLSGSILVSLGLLMTAPSLFVVVALKDSSFENAKLIVLAAGALGLIIYQLGLALYEANAIQFGVDQMLFSSSEDLSQFIHWYYWSLCILDNSILIVVLALMISTKAYILMIVVVLSSLFLFVSIIFIHLFRRNLVTEPVGRVNPVKHIFKVLDYARCNSQPTFRSAFTYGEAPPSRLDLAKERYGGPFTTEQVEDVKSFGRVLLVLVSLFGFLFIEDPNVPAGLYYQYCSLLNTSGNSLKKFSMFISFSNFSLLVPLVAVPLSMLVIRPFIWNPRPTMLKKMGCGLFIVVCSSVCVLIIDIPLYNLTQDNNLICYALTLNESSYTDQTNNYSYIPVLIVLSQVLNGLATFLIFLTALEFILAQAPRCMQGLLIGMWYAYQAIGTLVKATSVLTVENVHCHFWPTSLKTVLALFSLIVYVVVSHHVYRYRQREEPSNINRQAIIEEYTERQLYRQEYYSGNFDSSIYKQ